MRADHDFATPAGHRRDDDAVESRAVLADDVFHLGPDFAGLLAGLDAELHQSEFRFVRDIGRTSLDHDRAADGLERRHGFRARPAQPMRHHRNAARRQQRGLSASFSMVVRGRCRTGGLAATRLRLARERARHQFAMGQKLVQRGDRLGLGREYR